MAKKKLTTTDEVLIKDVTIGKTLHKKGSKVPLTEKGKAYFQSQNYIK